MDVISLSKANKTLSKIKQLDESVVAPLAEDRFPTVDARLDWLEGQANKAVVENSKQIDLSKGMFKNTELVNGKIQLKTVGVIESGYTNNLIPVMTSNAEPAPYVISASGEGSETKAYKAFDENVNTWWFKTATFPDWIQVDFGLNNEKCIQQYEMGCPSSSLVAATSRMAKSWILKASNTGNFSGEEVILDIRNNETGWSASQVRTYNFVNNNKYRYYRFYITANNGNSGLAIGTIRMMEKATITSYTSSGNWESPIIDLGEGWKETKLLNIVQQINNNHLKIATPAMTNNTTPSGIVTASSYYSADYPWKAFDQNMSTAWQPNTNGSCWIKYEFDNPKTIVEYQLRCGTSSYANKGPGIWRFEGSNDDISWDVLHQGTQSTWNYQQTVSYPLTNQTAYKYYRLYIEQSAGNWPYIYEINMMEKEIIADIVIEISSSIDGISFTPYTLLDPNNPPQGRYIKLRATLSAQAQPGQTKTLDFNQSSPENTMTLNEYIEANGKLQLKNTYTYSMTDDGTLGTGKQFSVTINKANFKSIESIGVN
jgi:hypothetical protein